MSILFWLHLSFTVLFCLTRSSYLLRWINQRIWCECILEAPETNIWVFRVSERLNILDKGMINLFLCVCRLKYTSKRFIFAVPLSVPLLVHMCHFVPLLVKFQKFSFSVLFGANPNQNVRKLYGTSRIVFFGVFRTIKYMFHQFLSIIYILKLQTK